MTLLEDIKQMQQQGASEDQVVQIMRDRGVSYREISDALAQSKIKAAVEEPNMEPQQYMQAPIPEPGQQEYYAPAPLPSYDVPQPGQYDQYSQTQQQYQGASSDVVTEIAEQVVAEKLSELRKHLEKVIDLKSTFETRIESVDERLKKIEKVIDTLQSSVLRKVGDYVTNVQDIKNELVETQKTFATLVPEVKKATKHKSEHTHETHKHDHKK